MDVCKSLKNTSPQSQCPQYGPATFGHHLSDLNVIVSVIFSRIQRRASSYILAIGMAGTFPAIFTSLIYGSMSDRKGRIPIMRLPPLGSFIDVSITLSTIYFELPLFVMAIGKILRAA